MVKMLLLTKYIDNATCLKVRCNGLFTLPDSDTDSNSDSDCKPNGNIVQCRTIHTAWSEIQIPTLTANYIGSESGSELESGSINVNTPELYLNQ